ncbi:MAG: hypothetical protein ACR2K9_07345 [Solirubrobacteraceae bacterium]
MGVFFIDVESGRVATQRQLVDAGVAPANGLPERPWFRIQGTGDATTMWYAVMRKATRGIFIGALAIRHGPQHASLLQRGWDEVPVPDIGLHAEPAHRE